MKAEVFNNGKPIVAIDIDGTLGDWHGHFLKFAEGYLGRRMPSPTDINPGLPLHKHMHCSKATYRKVKLAFRQGGLKRSMPAFENARELCSNVRKAGAEVWVCTTRPYLRLDQIDPDTRHWLRRNGIQHDAVLFGEHKYRDLVKHVGKERVSAVLDDLPEMYDQAYSLGLNAILVHQPYNTHVVAIKAMDLFVAEIRILEGIAEWKSKSK